MVNEKMTAIADAIRSKTGGTEKLGLDAMASSIEDVYDKGYDDGIAVYEEDYTNVVPNATESKSNQIFNGIGYKNDWRQNNDGSGYASSGKVSIGLINYIVPNSGLPSTIYIKGNVSLDGAIVQLWKANKVYVTELYSIAPYFTITEIKNGYFKLVPIAGSNDRSPLVDNCGTGISYFSFILNGNGDNLIITLDDPISSAVENAYNEGRSTLFAETLQGGNRTNYDYAFRYWDIEYFDAPYPVKATQLYGTFDNCKKMKKIKSKVIPAGSHFTHLYIAFQNCLVLEEIDFDLPINAAAAGFNSSFRDCKKLKTIKKIILDGKEYGWSYCFYQCLELANITFEGDIKATSTSSLSFADSPLLTNDSVQSIIDHLFDYTGDTARTLWLHANVKARMTDAQKAQITEKNWNLT